MKKSDQINILCGCDFGGIGNLDDEMAAAISDGFCLDNRAFCKAVPRLEK